MIQRSENITIRGVEYRVSELTVKDLVELDREARRRAVAIEKDVVDDLVAAGALTAEEGKDELQRRLASAGEHSWNSPTFLLSTHGAHHATWRALRHAHPEITFAEVGEKFGARDLPAVIRVVVAMMNGEDVEAAPAVESGAGAGK